MVVPAGKYLKFTGFLMFSVGIKKDHWPQMGERTHNVLTIFIPIYNDLFSQMYGGWSRQNCYFTSKKNCQKKWVLNTADIHSELYICFVILLRLKFSFCRYRCEENKPSVLCLLIIVSFDCYSSFIPVYKRTDHLKFSVISEGIYSTCSNTYTQQIQQKNIRLEVLWKEAVLL